MTLCCFSFDVHENPYLMNQLLGNKELMTILLFGGSRLEAGAHPPGVKSPARHKGKAHGITASTFVCASLAALSVGRPTTDDGAEAGATHNCRSSAWKLAAFGRQLARGRFAVCARFLAGFSRCEKRALETMSGDAQSTKYESGNLGIRPEPTLTIEG